MMTASSFEEWVTSESQPPPIQRFADRLVDLGASWDSFRREQVDVVNDLVAGGIPILAAQDIVRIVSQAAALAQSPLAIFWDLENMPVPQARNIRVAVARLKSILIPHGNLVQFRGYASLGLGHIPQDKRSDLQLSGCHLVDCTYHGRREVADKMIIVDAMQFVFEHPASATLCFIAPDADYAYLREAIQRPQWRTIVISKRTVESMLHVNCDVKLCWATDILRLESSQGTGDTGAPRQVTDRPTRDSAHQEKAYAASERNAWPDAGPPVLELEGTGPEGTVELDKKSMASFESLTVGKGFANDMELLRTVIRDAALKNTHYESIPPGFARKADVGNALRLTNPNRFPDRDAIQNFLIKAIGSGTVTEMGTGAFKALRLSSAAPIPPILLSDPSQLPDEAINAMSAKIISVAHVRPFILFVEWRLCHKGTAFPDKTFVQACGRWAVLMFQTLVQAHRVIRQASWLSNGTLVDWRRRIRVPVGESRSFTASATQTEAQLFDGAATVVAMLKTMETNDDFYMPERKVEEQLVLGFPDECPHQSVAAAWISAAIGEGSIFRFIRLEPMLCLLELSEQALLPLPPNDTDFQKEEDYVVKLLLQTKQGWMPRKEVISRLKDEFLSMEKPGMRIRMFLKARKWKRFFVAKGSFGQIVGIDSQVAFAALPKRPDNDWTSAKAAFCSENDKKTHPLESKKIALPDSDRDVKSLSSGPDEASDSSDGSASGGYGTGSSDEEDSYELERLVW